MLFSVRRGHGQARAAFAEDAATQRRVVLEVDVVGVVARIAGLVRIENRDQQPLGRLVGDGAQIRPDRIALGRLMTDGAKAGENFAPLGDVALQLQRRAEGVHDLATIRIHGALQDLRGAGAKLLVLVLRQSLPLVRRQVGCGNASGFDGPEQGGGDAILGKEGCDSLGAAGRRQGTPLLGDDVDGAIFPSADQRLDRRRSNGVGLAHVQKPLQRTQIRRAFAAASAQQTNRRDPQVVLARIDSKVARLAQGAANQFDRRGRLRPPAGNPVEGP